MPRPPAPERDVHRIRELRGVRRREATMGRAAPAAAANGGGEQERPCPSRAAPGTANHILPDSGTGRPQVGQAAMKPRTAASSAASRVLRGGLAAKASRAGCCGARRPSGASTESGNFAGCAAARQTMGHAAPAAANHTRQARARAEAAVLKPRGSSRGRPHPHGTAGQAAPLQPPPPTTSLRTAGQAAPLQPPPTTSSRTAG